MRPMLAAFLLVLTLVPNSKSAAGAQEAGEYEIRLNRPAKAGTKSSVTSSGELLQQVTVVANGQRQKQPALQLGLKLQGILEITRVDDRGREQALKCTVEEGTILKDGQEIEKLAKGAVILAEAGEKETAVRLENGELSPMAKAALQVAFSLKKSAGPNDDELYGTPDKHKPGASWPANAELLAKELSLQGLGVKKEHVEGKTTLTKVEKVGDESLLHLLVELNVHGFTSPVPAGMPAGFKGGPGSVKIKMSVVYPLDAAKERRADTESTTIFLLIGGPGGTLVETDIRKTRDARYIPIP